MPVVRPLLLLWLCYGAMMSLAIAINLLPVFLTTLGSEFGGAEGLTQEQLGRLGGIAFAGLVVGIIITGPLADRCGAKPIVLIGDLMIAAGLAGTALAPSYVTLAWGVFALGLGAGALDMVLSPVVAALAPDRRTAAMNWLHSFYGIGAVVTIAVATAAPWLGLSWRGACWALMPLPLVLLLAFAAMRFPALVGDGGRTPLAGLMRNRWFLGALIAILLGGATELGMAQWLPAYAETTLAYPRWIGGAALAAFSLATVLGRVIVAAAGPRLDPYRTMAWSCAASVVLLMVAAYAPVPGVALAGCVAAGLAGSCLWPTMLAVAADRHPDGGASMFGVLAAFGNAGGIVMPWMVGWIADLADLRLGLALSAVAPALMLPLVLALRRSR